MMKKAGRPPEPVLLTDDERMELERRVKAPTVSKRDSECARIILLRSTGMSQEEVSVELGCSSPMVSKWTARYRRDGLDGLKDKPGRGRKPRLKAHQIEKVITQVSQPPEGRERWSTRTMAKAANISHSTVQRLWDANDLKPHQTNVFKVSNDANF